MMRALIGPLQKAGAKVMKTRQAEFKGSLWAASALPALATPALQGAVSADLVIIGGGFTGCAAALTAAKAGAKVCLIEAETIGHGGSGRNVGLVNAGLWMPPAEIRTKMGAEAGDRLSRILAGAPEKVFGLIAAHDIQCDPVRKGTLHCAHAGSGLADLRMRHAQLAALGAPVQLLDKAETSRRTGTDRFHGALFDPRAGTIQPLSYVRGLARAAMAAGAAVHEGTPARQISHSGTHWLVETGQARIEASALLVATNAYHLDIAGVEKPGFVPVHYFQMATRGNPGPAADNILQGGEGCWDTALIMSSVRRDRDGRVIIGAIGNLDHAGAFLHRDWAGRKLAQLFPALAGTPLDYAWSGRIAMTADHLPKIVTLGQNGYLIAGFSGRGIGPGTLFGTSVAEAILTGNQDSLPLQPVAAHRQSFTGIGAAYYETGAALIHLLAARR
ncbi:MAG: FAD-binding oxidoreductase [Paracoccaceae bacterium]